MAQGYCTFMVAGQFFGTEVEQVQEVLTVQPMTQVPLAPRIVQGLINLRGQIVTAIDLRRRLNLQERPQDMPPMNVVLRTEEGAVSLLVDEIGDVLEVEQSEFELAPDTVDSNTRECIRGVYKLKERLLLVLDTERAIRAGHSQ